MAHAEKFWIEYNVETFDCGYIADDSNAAYEGFMMHAMVGTAKLCSGDKSVIIPSCGLLGLSRSLIRLYTFPVMYNIEAFETVLDTEFDFHSTFDGGMLKIEVKKGAGHTFGIETSVVEALRSAGQFHSALLRELFAACPPLRQHPLLLVRIPDAFALAQKV